MNEVRAFAELQSGARFSESRVQKQEAVRVDPMSGDRLSGKCQNCGNTKLCSVGRL